jgi:hypothetical protein
MSIDSSFSKELGIPLPPEFLHLANSVDAAVVVREPHMAEKVVIVDGLPGCGKTMLSPIMGSIPRVELMQYAYELEYVCSLRFLGRIEEDAANTLVRIFTDLRLYNVTQSRETNFRPSDLSSVFKHSRRLQYFRRLFQRGDAAALDRIRSERPILHLTMHNITGFSAPIFAALGSRVLLVNVLRHPLYMVRQQALYSDRYGADVRDFNVWHDHNGVAVPYFALGWEDQFLEGTPVEKSIYMMHYLTKRQQYLMSSVEGYDRNIMEIPFERYVTDPWPFMDRLETLLDTRMDSRTRRTMKKQNVPRKMYAEGVGLKIYKEYGWKPPSQGADERSELEERHRFAAENASSEAMQVLDQLCEEYEEKYLQGV